MPNLALNYKMYLAAMRQAVTAREANNRFIHSSSKVWFSQWQNGVPVPVENCCTGGDSNFCNIFTLLKTTVFGLMFGANCTIVAVFC